MAGVTKCYITGRYRLLRTFSYRDENNKPQNKKKIIGTFDPATDEPIYNQYFLDLIAKQNVTIERINDVGWRNIPKIVDFGTFDNKNSATTDKKSATTDKKSTPTDKNINKSSINDKSRNTIIIADNDHLTYDITDFSCKKYGSYLLLRKIITDTGLLNILDKNFPDKWQDIITFAFYLISTNQPLKYYDTWAQENTTYTSKQKLTFRKINSLLSSFSQSDLTKFYEQWAKLNKESEYLAFDLVSKPLYPNLPIMLEPSSIRDEAILPPANHRLIFGGESGLPIFLSLYPSLYPAGSQSDQSALEYFVDHDSFFSDKNYTLVLDSNLYSRPNIDFLLKNYPSYKFLISMPFISVITKQLMKMCESQITDNLYSTSLNTNLVGISVEKIFVLNHLLKYHAIFDSKLERKLIGSLHNEVLELQETAFSDPKAYSHLKEFNKYLIFDKDSNKDDSDIDDSDKDDSETDDSETVYPIINTKKIIADSRNSSWFFMVGNDLDLSYEEAFKLYGKKARLEEAFHGLKNNLDLSPIRVYNEQNVQNSLFIAFISLTILSHIHKVMDTHNLHKNYTPIELLQSLDDIKLLNIDNEVTISPISQTNRDILSFFGIEIT
ncbi:MAG: hypothetical protein LBF58_09040 [Deltaproteobacteria bacterium]|jgi:hypothetical protein|nr:hypothetical protein [Deltaproteobacteria bacterium]